MTMPPLVRGLGTLCALLIAAGPAPLLAAGYAALSGLEPGEWELKPTDDPGAARRLCVRDLEQLLQMQHKDAACRRFIVRNDAEDLAVSYDCGAQGNGRTDLRVETARLVQIRSQGIAKGAPFAFALEARRLGACPAKAR